MAQPTLEELRKTVELLKEVEGLQDASIRTQMQQLILRTVTPMEAPAAPTPVPPPPTLPPEVTPKPPSRRRSVDSANEGVPSAFPAPGTLRAKVYEAVAVLASAERPLACSELEKDLPDVPHEALAKTLSQLYVDGLLRRRQMDETARDGYTRALYKYYVRERPS